MVNTSGSEDGQLRSPNDGHYISGDDEEHDADALYIQPPQATSSQGRDAASTRREKKKHSRDRRHKERNSLESVERERDRRERERDRFEYRTRDDLEQRYHHQHHQHRSERAKHQHLSHAYHYQQQLPLPPPPSQSYAHHHHHQHHHHQQPQQQQQQQLMSLSRSGTRSDYYHSSRHADYADVEQPPPRRSSKHGYEQTKESESLEQDLRSRLLSKRHKYVKDYEAEENYEQQKQSHSRRKERDSRRGSHSHKLRHGQVIELLDSPESAAAQQSQRSKQQRRAEAEAAAAIAAQQRRTTTTDPELLARREKILAAERENRQRKQIAREELEARREQLLRERNEHSDALSPTAVAASVTAGLNIVKRKQNVSLEDTHYERRKRSKQSSDDVKPQSKQKDNESEATEEETESEDDEDEDEEESGSAESASESAESVESQPHKRERSKRKRKQQDDDEEEVPLPDSPLSVGALYKSPKQRPRSRSASSKSSQHSHSSGSSNSNSRNSSHSRSSRSRSRSPASSVEHRQRSRSSSTRSEERGMAQQQQQLSSIDNVESNLAEKLSKAPIEELPPCDDKGIPLPNYYPGVQGCRSVEEFQCLNRIEEGTYGVVYRAKDKRTNEIVALKRLKMEKEKEGFPITSLREINTLLKGQHPNIVTVREIVVGSNMDKIFIVMDYVEHDLKSLMETMKQRKQSFFPGEVKCLTQQLLLAVAHLHDNWILHRDLKTSNLLLSHKGILKVGDFGLAREYGSPLKKYTSLVVTLWYRAPELLLCSPEYSTPIDVWSVGCIFAEFLQMLPLFPGKSEIDELNRIFKELGTPNEKIWPGYSELPAVKNMLSQNSQFTDYPVSQLRKHFQDKTSDAGLALLQGLLTYDPKQRLTADAALKHAYFKELPLPIDPSMFPTWPAKSELGARNAQASSPKPPSGGSQFKQLGRDEPMATSTAVGGGGAKLASGIITGNKKSGATAASTGFVLNAGITQRQMAMGPGFSLKF